MKHSTKDFSVLATVTEYARFYGLPAPAHPLLTVVNMTTFNNLSPSIAATPVVQQLYTVSLKRNLGGAALQYGQQSYDFNEGVMSFLAPGQGCWADYDQMPDEASGWMVIFHPDLLGKYPLGKKIMNYGFFSYQLHEALHLSAQEEELLGNLVNTIRDENDRSIDSFSEEVIISQLDLLLTYCNRFYHRQFATRRTVEHDTLSRFEALLFDYFRQPDTQPLPTVQYFANALHLSPSYLSDMLRALTGQNTQQHIHQALIEKAKRLLMGTSLSIKETAYQLGFEYPQYFSRLFKNKTGLTPAEFRAGLN